MNKKYDLIVFTNGPSAYAPLRVMEEAKKRGLKFRIMEYRDIKLNFNKDILPEAKGVFLRGMGEDVNHLPLKYFIINNYRGKSNVLNLKSFDKWLSLDKVIQHIEYGKHNIPTAKSYYFGSLEEALKTLKGHKFPMIVKFNAGSKGKSVYKAKNITQVKEIFKQEFDVRTMLFQDFIKGGEDIRIIVLGGKVIGAMKRIAQPGQYLTNYSQGGEVVHYDIQKDPEAKKLSLKVAKLFKLDYCGVDLMKNSEGNWVVLEVNRACQFQGFEKSTGINVAEQIVEYLVK